MTDYRPHLPCFPDAEISAFYEVKHPWSEGLLVAFGDGSMGWYDWLAVDGEGNLLHRSADQYGCPEVALRDALIWATREG